MWRRATFDLRRSCPSASPVDLRDPGGGLAFWRSPAFADPAKAAHVAVVLIEQVGSSSWSLPRLPGVGGGVGADLRRRRGLLFLGCLSSSWHPSWLGGQHSQQRGDHQFLLVHTFLSGRPFNSPEALQGSKPRYGLRTLKSGVENPDALPPGDRRALEAGRAFLPQETRGAEDPTRNARRILGQEHIPLGADVVRGWDADGSEPGRFLVRGNAGSWRTRFPGEGTFASEKDAVRSEGTVSAGTLGSAEGTQFLVQGTRVRSKERFLACSGTRFPRRMRFWSGGRGFQALSGIRPSRASASSPSWLNETLSEVGGGAPGGRYHSTR